MDAMKPGTPLPWRRDTLDRDWLVWGGEDCVADCTPQRDFAPGMTSACTNAAYIVAACNAFPALLAACEAMPDFDIDSPDAADFKDHASEFMEAMRLARDAIAQARGA